ncbi:hypothetical protein Tco_0618554 [Tanacetum coccineum]
MEDEQVAIVDGVFEGAFGALGDESWWKHEWMPWRKWWLMISEEDNELVVKNGRQFTGRKLFRSGVLNQRMSTPVFVDPEIFTQADGAQSTRVPVPLPEDPYEAIRQAYLDGTNTESEPFKDPIETETHETARMSVRVPPAMSPGLSASMAEVADMSESTFRKRFRPSYESSPSSSPPDLPLRKRYRGTSELVEDDDEEDKEIDESLDSDSVIKDVEDEGPTAEDEDPVMGDKGLAAGDEGPSMGVERRGLVDKGHSVESDVLGLGEEEEAVPEGQQWAVSVVGTTVSVPLGLGYGALRRRELALEEDHVYNTFEVGHGYGSAPDPERPERVSTSRRPTLTTWTDPEDGMVYIDVPAKPPPAPPVQTTPSLEWSSGSLSISPSPFIVPSPISSPVILLTVPSPVTTLATAKTEGFLTELGAQVEMQGGLIRDHVVRLEELSPALFKRYDRDIGELFTRQGAVKDEIFYQRYRFRSLEHEQEMVVVTFGALWRPVLAMES